MALRISLAPPTSLYNPSPVVTSLPPSRRKFLTPPKRDGEVCSGTSGGASCFFFAARDRVLVRSSLETDLVTVGQVTEVNKDTFWPIVQAANQKIVVLDMYTQW